MKTEELKKLIFSYIALLIMFAGISTILRLYLSSFLDVWHMSSLGKYLLLNTALSVAGVFSAMICFVRGKIGLVASFGIAVVLIGLDVQRIWIDINSTLGSITLAVPVFLVHLYLLVVLNRVRLKFPHFTGH